MISIIVCSRKDDISADLKQNIAETVGCQYELVIIGNPENRYTIFTAYNEGVSRSKGDIVCFMHDDVLFRTREWGSIITRHFVEDERIGMIGFAGTHFLPDTPMYWYSSPFISQRNLNNDNGIVEEHFHEGWFGHRTVIEAVAVDGFCFFVQKGLFEKVRFDEKTYTGFHIYDMDLCMQVIDAGYKVCVCRDILIEHCWSEESQFTKKGSELFLHNLGLFVNVWQHRLPIWRGLDLPEEVFERVNGLYKAAYQKRNLKFSHILWQTIRKMFRK